MNLKQTLAIDGGAPAVRLALPVWPRSDEIDAAHMAAVVRSGQWSWNGPHEQAFCREFARLIGSQHALLLANGTVTLQCALQAVGVEPGDEVIVPGVTWVATLQAALDIGANAVVVDVDPETACLDPKAFEKAITPRTKAVIPVHLYGCMCDMDAILEIAARHKIRVVEDVAHQHGSRWRNRGAGALGDVGSFSFQQTKVLTCGEGGAISCDDAEILETIHCLKHVGFKPDLSTPGERYGHNYRATEMQAVLLRGGLRRLPEELNRREDSAAFLTRELARIGGPLRVAKADPRVTRQCYYGLTLHFDPDKAAGVSRECYHKALAAEGLGLSMPYPPVYAHPLLNLYHQTSPVPYRDPACIQDYKKLKLPITERWCRETGLMLFHSHLLGDDAYLGQLVSAVGKVNDNLGKLGKQAST